MTDALRPRPPRPKLPRDVVRLAELGWRLCPSSATSRAACFEGALDAATTNLAVLEAWAYQYPCCNWRAVMAGSMIWCLDIDRPSASHEADGFAAMARLISANTPLPSRPTSRSGGGGCALFFRDGGHPVRGKSGWPEPGLDPRAGRLTITVPPSTHTTTGNPYRWLCAPWELAPPLAPAWLLAAVAPPPEPPRAPFPFVATTDRAFRRLRRAVEAVVSARPGVRNDTLNAQAFAVARHVASGMLGESEAVEALYGAACHAGLDRTEARNTIRSGFRGGLKHPFTAEARP